MPAWQDSPVVQTASNSSAVTAANAFEANDLGEPGYQFCASDNPVGGSEDGCRELPDVSADADEFTGAITIFSAQFGGWTTIGGTSSAAPMWAAHAGGRQRLGDVPGATPRRRTASASSARSSTRSRRTRRRTRRRSTTSRTGNNDPFGDSNLFQATTGYDMASGLGTPELTQPNGEAGLAFYLCSQAPAVTRPTVTNLSPASGLTSASDTERDDHRHELRKERRAGCREPPGRRRRAPVRGVHGHSPTHDHRRPSRAASVVRTRRTTRRTARAAYQVTVTLNDGETSAVNMNSGFTFVDDNGSAAAIPAVTGVHTFAGTDAGGNTVDVYGAGFTGATSVTFGGVAASTFTVNRADWQIAATVPAYQDGVTSCDESGSSFGGERHERHLPGAGQVTTPNGQSQTSRSSRSTRERHVQRHRRDRGAAGDEAAPAATEYDYVPTPTITSISTDNGPGSLASENGDSLVTITGTGLNLAALDWVNFGDPTQAASQQFFDIVSDTGTEIQIVAPALADETSTRRTSPSAS